MTGVAAVVVAAGEGRRFGSAKQFALLGGRPVLEWSLAAFQSHPRVGEIVLVLPDEALGPRFAAAFGKVSAVVRGGARRQDSVFAGFSRLDRNRAGSVVERMGRPVALAEGDPLNIKITTLLDLKWAEEFLHAENRTRI
jgi:2-C-methyl-D-erythritol 4-phosphate cytidylyltransferase